MEDIRITYETAYVNSLDITVIMKFIFKGNEEPQQYISGYYYGRPNLEDIETYKDKNRVN